MSDRKAVIKNADMGEEMQQDAVDCATQALEKYNIEKVSDSYLLWANFKCLITCSTTQAILIGLQFRTQDQLGFKILSCFTKKSQISRITFIPGNTLIDTLAHHQTIRRETKNMDSKSAWWIFFSNSQPRSHLRASLM